MNRFVQHNVAIQKSIAKFFNPVCAFRYRVDKRQSERPFIFLYLSDKVRNIQFQKNTIMRLKRIPENFTMKLPFPIGRIDDLA
jgi:hypothetical protein